MWGILLLLGQLASGVVPAQADWIGTLEFTDSRGYVIAPTTAHLTISDTGTVTGRWAGRSQSGGDVTGTITHGDAKLRIMFFGGATMPNANGHEERIAAERCAAEAEFTGTLYPSGVLKLTAKRVAFDTPITRAKNTACDDLTRLTWILQPHLH